MKLVDFGTIEGESKQNVFSYYNDVKSNTMHFLIIKIKQDAGVFTGVHSACRREENGHNLDICVLRRLRLRQGQMQGFLGLKVGGRGVNLQIWDLNRAHETERTVFPILQVFSMCRQ